MASLSSVQSSSGLFGATTKEKILHFQADEADEGLE